MKNKVIYIAVLLLVAAGGAYLYNKYRVAPALPQQQLQLSRLTGEPFALETLKGQNVLVGFFATWCGPCMAEVPSLLQAADALAPDNFVFVLISDEPATRLQHFSRRTGSRITVLHSQTPLKQLGIHTIPTTYILNAQGQTVLKEVGAYNWASPEKLQQLRALVQ